MSYCALTDVKPILRITSTDTSHDTEVTNAITDACTLIDVHLSLYITVPLQPTYPEGIPMIAKYFAAAIYLNLYPVSDISYRQAERYWQLADKLLDEYIRRTYYIGKVFST